MRADHSRNSAGPSVKERVKALHDSARLFEMIAEFPQTGVHQKFSKEWALVNAYVESKVNLCRRSLETFVKNTLESEAPDPNEAKYAAEIEPLMNSLLLHACVTESRQRMARSPLPSAYSMDLYRICSRVKEPGMRAANGEMALNYDEKKRPVPRDLGVILHEDLEPMTHFVYEWIAIPVQKWLNRSSEHMLNCLPLHKDRENHEEDRGLISEKLSEPSLIFSCIS